MSESKSEFEVGIDAIAALHAADVLNDDEANDMLEDLKLSEATKLCAKVFEVAEAIEADTKSRRGANISIFPKDGFSLDLRAAARRLLNTRDRLTLAEADHTKAEIAHADALYKFFDDVKGHTQ